MDKCYVEIANGIVQRGLVMDGSWTDKECKAWLNAKVSKNEWIETKLDGSMRNKYAGPGDEYHADLDSFISPKPFDSWTLNKRTKKYEAPSTMPKDNKPYIWNEELQTWELTEIREGM